MLTLLNDYSASYSLMVVCFCELIAVNYVYGNGKFCEDLELMLGFKPNIYWRACWLVITPLAILVRGLFYLRFFIGGRDSFRDKFTNHIYHNHHSHQRD